MEIFLAITVAVAVFVFGALISLGNERQRKAIDGLGEQIIHWAIQDLRIKREHLALDIRVENPLAWLNQLATKACSYEGALQIIETCEQPHAIVCSHQEGGQRMIFSLLSPSEIKAMKGKKGNRLASYGKTNPLLMVPRAAHVHECSVLNEGILFDLQLPLAWKAITGWSTTANFLWIYVIP